MARAKRHYIPGQIWHITHRCHKREFLLKFAKDRKRWLNWLFEAKKRYGLVILNYTVTSNHIHLLVSDDKVRSVIPDSIKLIAGRTAQEYNKRKHRKGAFWEDRYHATAIEEGDHFLKCLVYMDLNMVRAGVIDHPTEWAHCGYNEIQNPVRKKILIDYERLRELIGYNTYEQVKSSHKKWIESRLVNGVNSYDEKWSRSIAVGSSDFIDNIKTKMGVLAIGRKKIEIGESYQLRESQTEYGSHFEVKKRNIAAKNSYFW